MIYQNSTSWFYMFIVEKLLIYRKCKSICTFGSEVKKIVMFVLTNRW